MAEKKEKAQLIRRKKFISVDVPLTHQKIEIIGNNLNEINSRNIKLDLTRQLKGKSVELVVKIHIINDKAVALPSKLKLMSYFIRRMIRKRISYVEDSLKVKSQESMVTLKPFLITKRRVSRAIRKTLRNKTKNWIEDYIAQKTDLEIFNEILSNKMQKSLSLMLKKTYPLSLCEIRTLELGRKLNPEEIPLLKPKEHKEEKTMVAHDGLDQLQEIEDERIRLAESEIKETQDKAIKLQDEISSDSSTEQESDNSKKEEKPKKTRKKKEE